MTQRDMQWLTFGWIVFIFILIAWAMSGCVAGGKVSTTQPIDVEQLSGQIVAKIAPVIKAEVTANVQGIGYTSYFGVGVTVVMSLAVVWLGWIAYRGIEKAVCRYPTCDHEPRKK